MKDDRLEGKWDQVKGEAKEEWGKLTGDESTELSGRKDQAKGEMKEGYGEAKDKLSGAMNDLVDDDDDTNRH